MSIGKDECINVLLTQGLSETKGPKEKKVCVSFNQAGCKVATKQ